MAVRSRQLKPLSLMRYGVDYRKSDVKVNKMKIRWLCLSLVLLLSACDLGPLSKPTPTLMPTATSSPTQAPTSTETPTATSTATTTATATVTETLSPTAVSCPKGTVLLPSLNKCFYATRTPRPEIPYCQQFDHKAACISNGCSWHTTGRFCD